MPNTDPYLWERFAIAIWPLPGIPYSYSIFRFAVLAPPALSERHPHPPPDAKILSILSKIWNDAKSLKDSHKMHRNYKNLKIIYFFALLRLSAMQKP